MMAEVGYCNGIENYSRHLTGRMPGEPPPCLFDYLPPDALLVVDESHVTVPQIGAHVQGRPLAQGDAGGVRFPPAVGARQPAAEVRGMGRPLAAHDLRVGDARRRTSCEKSEGQVVELVVRPTGLIDPEVEIRPVATQVDDLLGEITERVAMGDRVLVTTLTKRMAENLTEYLGEHGVRVRYLHSDIETVERVEIIRDLRLGKFDVLVGINLLREGLDMPEVSLVAILDADKEGFLRSAGSLIQTIGRAARNLRGKAILYADSVTRSMQAAIDETDRRRAEAGRVQRRARHHAGSRSPRPILDIMEGARSEPEQERRGRGKGRAWPSRRRTTPRWPGAGRRRGSRRWSSRCTSTRATWSSRTPPACATRSAGSRTPC